MLGVLLPVFIPPTLQRRASKCQDDDEDDNGDDNCDDDDYDDDDNDDNDGVEDDDNITGQNGATFSHKISLWSMVLYGIGIIFGYKI